MVNKEEQQLKLNYHKCIVEPTSKLTCQEKMRAMEGLMFLTLKKSGDVKGRLAYNGKHTRQWIDKEDKASPTVLTESIMLLAGIDAAKNRDVMVLDIPNAFIQTPMPVANERIVMKVKGRLVDWLLELDGLAYSTYVVYKNGVKTLYLVLQKAILGMLVASMLWYQKFCKDLESIDFVFNEFDPCVVNRIRDGNHHPIRYHVDDVISSHLNSKVNDEFAAWANKVYGKLKKVEVHCGRIHDYLGMCLNFQQEKGKVHISQCDHVADLIES